MKLTQLTGVTQRHLFGAVIGVLGIVGAQRQQAWANDIAYRETIYRTDFATAGVGGLRNVGLGTIKLSGVTGVVNRAYLYWGGPMNTTNVVRSENILVNGQNVTGVNIGFSSDNCWGYLNGQAYRADVTSLVAAKRNGDYTISGVVNLKAGINANGASLMAFFDDGIASNNRDIVLFDGNDSNGPNPYDKNGWNIGLEGIHYTNGPAMLQLHVSDGQSYVDEPIMLNGSTLAARGGIFQGSTVPTANAGPLNNGSLWDIKSWSITSRLTPGENTLRMTHTHTPDSDCIALIAAVINLPAGAAPPPPNNPPFINGQDALTITRLAPEPIRALIGDTDGDDLTWTIIVDGQMLVTGQSPGNSRSTGTSAIEKLNQFSLGQHIVLITVDDGQASASHTMTVNVLDNKPPVLNLPPNIVVPSDPGKNTAVVTYTVTATDDFPGVSVLSMPPSGMAFPIGVTTVNATAVDAGGNTTRGSFTITVTDAMPPVIQCPTNMVCPSPVSASRTVVFYTIIATDNQPGVTALCLPASGTEFPLGITPVTCVARDAAGNTATCMFTVCVRDNQPPVITVPTNIITAADLNQCSAIVNYNVSVSDDQPGVTLRCLPASGTAFPIGTNIVACQATDASGNMASASFKVIIRDVQPPLIQTLSASPSYLYPKNKKMIPVSLTVCATDACSNPVTCRITGVKVSDGDVKMKMKSPKMKSPSPGANTSLDVQITGPLTLNLRASSSSKTRTYTITVECRDAAGNVSLKTVNVVVPYKKP